MRLVSTPQSTSVAGVLAREVVASLVAAAVATQVKVMVEGALQPVAERVFPPGEAELEEMGADPGGHPENMPPQVLVARVGRVLLGEPLADEARDAASEAVHWGTGLGAGVAYGLLAHRMPWLRAGRGALFGATLFAVTHGSLLPAVDIQAPLAQLPRSWWVWEPGSHLVFGAVTDLVLTIADALSERSAKS